MGVEALWLAYFGDASLPALVPGYSNAGTVVLESGRFFGGNMAYYHVGSDSIEVGLNFPRPTEDAKRDGNKSYCARRRLAVVPSGQDRAQARGASHAPYAPELCRDPDAFVASLCYPSHLSLRSWRSLHA